MLGENGNIKWKGKKIGRLILKEYSKTLERVFDGDDVDDEQLCKGALGFFLTTYAIQPIKRGNMQSC